MEKLFAQIGHTSLVSGRRKLYFLPEFLHLGEECLGFIGHMISEEGNGLNDVVDYSFELLSWFKLCVISHREGVLLGTAEGT